MNGNAAFRPVIEPDYFDLIEAALTFARGQTHSKESAEMVEKALRAFDRVKEATRGRR